MKYFKPDKNLWLTVVYFVIASIIVAVTLFTQSSSFLILYEVTAYIFSVIFPLIHAVKYGPHFAWPLMVCIQTSCTFLAFTFIWPADTWQVMTWGAIAFFTFLTFIANWVGGAIRFFGFTVDTSTHRAHPYLIPAKRTLISEVVFLALWALAGLITVIPSNDGIGQSILMLSAWLAIAFLVPLLDAYANGANLTWIIAYAIMVLGSVAVFSRIGLGFGYYLAFGIPMLIGLAIGHCMHKFEELKRKAGK